MQSHRRSFLKTTALGGLGLTCSGTTGLSAAPPEDTPAGPGSPANAQAASAPPAARHRPEFVTELFLDNRWIESSPGVSRRLQPPRKHLLNPVIQPRTWCEGTYIEPYTTLYDPDERLFKMWARGGSDSKAGFVGGNAAWMLYYTSQDGLRWQAPHPGVLEVAGRRDHNIVFVSDQVPRQVARFPYGPEQFVIPTQPIAPQGKKAFFWSVNRHPRPRDPSETWVALAIVQDHRRGAQIVTSPDGLHWSTASSPFWQTPHDVAGNGDDCLMHLVFDTSRDKWVIYRRIIPEFSGRMLATADDLRRPPVDRYNRSYARAESDDLQTWTGHRHILAMDPDDPADTELYQFGCHQLGQTWVGFVSVFYLRSPQPINVHLATSRDGIEFTRVCRGEPFIPHGPLGYHDFMAMACSQPRPIVVNDVVYIYYAALNYPHDSDESASAFHGGGVALATLPRDRYAALETTPPDTGLCRVLTRPFSVTHPKLFLNAATWDQGTIRVEVLSPDCEPLAGYGAADCREIRGDALDHPVTWNERGDLQAWMGREVRLKFHLTRARLHAMTLSDVPRQSAPVSPEHRQDRRLDSAPRQT
jgi:hypothetical protein